MSPEDIGAYAAKTHFSRILEQVKAGKTFYITRRGKRVAELRPVSVAETSPRYGCDRGRVTMTEDFDDPIPDLATYTE